MATEKLEPIVIRPHEGPQEQALASSADIMIFGGAAGCGKSQALLMEPLRHIENPRFGAVIFRRTYKQITKQGSLWDSAGEMYRPMGARSVQTDMTFHFESGAKIQFAHLEHETSKEEWLGAEIPLICFDELVTFSRATFLYMLSRNRTTCGIRPYVRATCNPDADSWVAKFIEWWIDQETGYPIEERSGVIRWFVVLNDVMEWGDTPEDLKERFPGPDTIPKSFTFIPAKLEDNPTLMERDPGYKANLLAQTYVDRMRLLGGNWKIRPETGIMFPRDKWIKSKRIPEGIRLCRAWDKAGTEGGTGARTAGVLIGEHEGRYYVIDAIAGRWNDIERENIIKDTAELDRERFGEIPVWLEQEPGSGGKDSAQITIRNLAGFLVYSERATGEKASRWRPFAAQVQGGNVVIIEGEWDCEDYIRELDLLAGEKKTDSARLKDLADASSLAFSKLINSNKGIFVNRPMVFGLPDNSRSSQSIPVTPEGSSDGDGRQSDINDIIQRMGWDD